MQFDVGSLHKLDLRMLVGHVACSLAMKGSVLRAMGGKLCNQSLNSRLLEMARVRRYLQKRAEQSITVCWVLCLCE